MVCPVVVCRVVGGRWRADRSLLVEGDDGNGEGEDGDNELRHADPERCVGHSATASLAVANAIQKSENLKSPAGIKARCLRHRVKRDTSPQNGCCRGT